MKLTHEEVFPNTNFKVYFEKDFGPKDRIGEPIVEVRVMFFRQTHGAIEEELFFEGKKHDFESLVSSLRDIADKAELFNSTTIGVASSSL